MKLCNDPLLRRNRTEPGYGLRAVNGMLYALIFLGQISAFDFVSSLAIAGFSPASYSSYLIYALALLSMCAGLFLLPNKTHRLLLLAAVIYIACLTMTGVRKTGDFANVIYESKNYVAFAALYFYVLWARPGLKSYVYLLYAILPFLAAASVLSSLGIMKGMESGTGDLLRGSENADGITAVVGALIAFYYMINPEDGIRPKYSLAAFVGAVVTVGVSMSRARIGILLLALFVLFVSMNRNNAKIRKRALAMAAVLILLALVFNRYTFPLIEQIAKRYDTVTDDNMIKRVTESARNMQIWKQSPLTGQGFGLMRRYGTNDHNSYAALLMNTGLIGFMLFIGWFVKMLADSRTLFRRFPAPNRYELTAVIMLAVAFLAYGNMGFKKMGGLLGMLYVYIAMSTPPPDKVTRTGEKTDAVTIGKTASPDRDIDLS